MPRCRAFAAAAFAGALLGCASDGREPPAGIQDVTWMWTSTTTSVETVLVDAPERYTISFAEGRVALRADCNRGSGPYSLGEDRQIAIGPLVLTRVACPPGSLSDRYVQDLERASSYFLKNGALILELSDDSGTVRFEQAR